MKQALLLLMISLPAFCEGVCFAPGTYRSPDPVAEQNFQQGNAYFEQKNYVAALPYLKASANRNHPRAQQELAQMYLQGWGVPVNNSVAVEYLKSSAAQGHRGSYWTLGEFYSYAWVDLPLADKYLQVAAQCGDVYAQTELGLNYEFGRGVPPNRNTAIYWLSQAAPHFGQAHYILDWLKRPNTPHFQNADQLSAYIGYLLREHIIITGRRPSFPGGPCRVGYFSSGHCYSTDDPTHTPMH
jgi:TPR repeat protein